MDIYLLAYACQLMETGNASIQGMFVYSSVELSPVWQKARVKWPQIRRLGILRGIIYSWEAEGIGRDMFSALT